MPTYILVLVNDQANARWLARKWGTDPAALTASCTYSPGTSQLFNKNPNDQIVACPCAKLTDPLGGQAAVIMVKLA
ncbi:hypothetical protein [Mucilaginibacter gotjawali]|uniref:Uncharacterized protein n=2 Tax=Mucilaginibacter gotjawali TaxID=1550579 RepID=A0A110AZG7_9SPHI|nr:hypothetical protein [Mucilaginibacter gotjawali]MBB3054299.1 hypothetical protein [Mucilaginibacter gotjawali]BAU51865.1 hypothetical protein MgSA37_00014 [Mucilaginibacter gotjawali]